MPSPRIYTPLPLNSGQSIELQDQAAIHIGRVLRMTTGDTVRLFNGDGHEYQSVISQLSKKSIRLEVQQSGPKDAPLSPHIHLGQVMSKGDRMDFVLQKATELGVDTITPLSSERCDVRLKADRLDKKRDHWQKIIISACEQCGRNTLPTLNPVQSFDQWLQQSQGEQKLILHPHQTQPLESIQTPGSVDLMIGPEGGFSEMEVQQALATGYQGLRLGPRILRTETAALTAISVLQYVWGDFR